MHKAAQEVHAPEASVWRALGDVSPLCLAVLPWGILCGSLGLQMGFSALQTQAMSLLVFAGAVQLSGTMMVGNAAGLPAVLSSTLVISARHLLYGAHFRQYITPLPLKWRLGLGFLLTDEMYALSTAHTSKQGRFSKHYALYTGAAFYVGWNLATLAGILAGSQLKALEAIGLDFAIAATFIALTVPSIKTRPVLLCALASGVSMLLFTYYHIPNALIIATGVGMVAGLMAESLPTRRAST
ncbi:branched-chain amino acid ABC transporter permease [Salinivibrio sp. IB868]|uniref:AzlC family ABC transporter permease n=1 Tax=unclassified Salinivibrio TaxID=2636825 RepID=UPI00098430F0|nr:MULTISPECIES: AzlC family ABC transporter permease [unclassified Salinivibrio]OOE65926.1 branched-chain amino acid ABC transporter permease [Salinivibrio sp. IB868]OOE72124.1 branched-chain amino acid ABC transporter permease [Salinivibrio sp. IB870]